jgi:hypothetical protein
MQIVGPGFDYFYLPAIHTCGGILVAWRSCSWVMSSTSTHSFSLSARVQHALGGPECWMTSVYGLGNNANKPTFLEELHELRLISGALG